MRWADILEMIQELASLASLAVLVRRLNHHVTMSIHESALNARLVLLLLMSRILHADNVPTAYRGIK
jgi:hypothetical protein